MAVRALATGAVGADLIPGQSHQTLTPITSAAAAPTAIAATASLRRRGATVGTLVTTGFFVGKWVKLYPIDAAIVNACHSGQGGTGDVAILTAANRMQLMPFAQIATRIGGAITVTTVLIVLTQIG